MVGSPVTGDLQAGSRMTAEATGGSPAGSQMTAWTAGGSLARMASSNTFGYRRTAQIFETPPFIYSIFLKTIPIHIFPLKILTHSYISKQYCDMFLYIFLSV
jgi:hypothetical protein